MQVGYKRAGWYTYDWFYRLIKSADFVDGHSSERIVPELQNLAVGDQIAIFAQGPFQVVALEPSRVLLLLARVDFKTGKTFEIDGPMPEQYLNNSWLFYLQPAGASATRLIVRYRLDHNPSAFNTMAYTLATVGGGLIFQPKMLRGVKSRAEAQAGQKWN